jgi:hypothetical protein
MAFIQIMQYRTSRTDDVRALADEWERATEGKRTVVRRVLCQDRDDPGQHFNIVFFDSYEAAMENSALAETDSLSKEFSKLTDGPMTFHNLDVVDDNG